MTADPNTLWRDSFDSAADAYDRGRPGYPPQLVDDLVTLAGIRDGSRVLEIGPGTGQLSVGLAERDVRLVALDRGANLAGVLRGKLARFPRAEVVTADFDRWDAPPASFDAVIAASSFHWLAPSTRMTRIAAILRPGGSLAVIQTRWGVAEGGDPFFAASQACYSQWNPSYGPAFQQVRPADVLDPCAELNSVFGDVAHRRYVSAREHDAKSYCALLGTFSHVLSLGHEQQAAFLDCIGRVIDAQFGGRITRHDLYDLCVARRDG